MVGDVTFIPPPDVTVRFLIDRVKEGWRAKEISVSVSHATPEFISTLAAIADDVHQQALTAAAAANERESYNGI